MAACRILVPRPGIEPWPSAVKAPNPEQWVTREFLTVHLFYFLKVYLFLTVLALHCCWLLLVVTNGGYSPVAVGRLLIVVASRVVFGLSCPAGGIFPDQGWNLCPLYWQVDS